MKGTHVQLESLGQEISEQDFKTQIILSLPLSWEQYAESSFAPDGKVNNIAISSHELIIHIQNEYKRCKGWRDAQGETTYQAKGKSLMKRISDTTSECPAKRKQTPCSICKHTNHREANCFFQPSAPRCTYCKKPRHLEKDCWSKSGGKGKGRAKPRKETANVTVVDEGSSGIEEIHVMYDSRNNSKTPSSYLWHADSGASSHVTSDFKALHNYIHPQHRDNKRCWRYRNPIAWMRYLSHPVTNPLPRTHALRMFNISSLVTPHVDKDTLYPTSCRTRVL
jgi:hypothetical protein